MESLPLPLLIFLIVLAIAVGLWLGGRTQREVEARKDGKPIATRLREAGTRGVLALFRWNRKRKREQAQRDRERERGE